jgi:hypothetical protein
LGEGGLCRVGVMNRHATNSQRLTAQSTQVDVSSVDRVRFNSIVRSQFEIDY